MTAQPAEKRVSWAELFFDLVFVFAITQVSALLLGDHSGAGLLQATVVFVPIYWTWVGTSIQANLRDMDRLRNRAAIFAVALAGLLMALAAPGAYHDRSVLFGGAYFGGRIVLGLVATGGRHWTASPFTVAMFVSGPLLLVGALLPPPARTAVWAVAALLDLSTPTVLKRRLAALHFEPGHLSERFGLFVLIAIGETVVAIGAPAAASEHLTAAALLAVAVAFLVAVSLWWVYFHFAPTPSGSPCRQRRCRCRWPGTCCPMRIWPSSARSSPSRSACMMRFRIPASRCRGRWPRCCTGAAPSTWRPSAIPVG